MTLVGVCRRVVSFDVLCLPTEVHEAGIVSSYPLLTEYLNNFVGKEDGLPDLEHHKATDIGCESNRALLLPGCHCLTGSINELVP